MTDERRTGDAETAAPGAGTGGVARRLLVLGSPLLLGGLFAVHPHGGGADLFEGSAAVAAWWLRYHLLLVPASGLLGAAVAVLLSEFDGPVATIGRSGAVVYVVGYVTFEAIAGIATGLLVRRGRRVPADHRSSVADVVDGAASDPVVVGFAIAGSLGLLVAVVALGVLHRRRGAPAVPLLLLGGAPVAAVAHGERAGAAVGMASFLVGVAWLERRSRRSDPEHIEQTA